MSLISHPGLHDGNVCISTTDPEKQLIQTPSGQRYLVRSLYRSGDATAYHVECSVCFALLSEPAIQSHEKWHTWLIHTFSSCLFPSSPDGDNYDQYMKQIRPRDD